jgi:hypothetical protein
VLRTTCSACRHGHHDECQGGQKPPPGVMGGWECSCDHSTRVTDPNLPIIQAALALSRANSERDARADASSRFGSQQEDNR